MTAPARRGRVWIACLAVAALVTAVGVTSAGAEPLRDAPIAWWADDRRDVPRPEEREPNLLWDSIEATVGRPFARHTRPSRLARRVGGIFGGEHAAPAHDVNALDEAPNSTWFTNRIGLFEMSVEDVARGPGIGTGPDPRGPWTVVSAKTQGVTPGFNVRDENGHTFLVKFDPPDYPGMASGAGVISARILHAAGYNVPDDAIVTFTRDQLVVGEGVQLKMPDGSRRAMTESDVDDILARVTETDGRWRAITSRFLDGRPIGPFDWEGTRSDDPNDLIPHQHLRVLRGLRTIAAWIAHFDLKQHNTLDMYVDDGDTRFVKHHLIDFASTIGTGASGPVERWGYEYTVDLWPFLGRTFALGLHQDAWRRLERPDLLEVGTFEGRVFDPKEFKTLQPNSAFANQTKRDAYWAAKIVSAFTDEHLAAIASQARYDDPEATRYVARVLAQRRDKIARTWFDEVPPLDYFRFERETLRYQDLGATRGIYPGTTARYRVRYGACTADRDVAAWSAPVESDLTALRVDASHMAASRRGDGLGSVEAYPFLVFECRVDRGRGFGAGVRVYVARRSARVVAVERG